MIHGQTSTKYANLCFFRHPCPTLTYNPLFQANSISESLSLLDFGTNYCNLFNLMDGSGLTKDEAYSEETDDGICTQHSSANCEIF